MADRMAVAYDAVGRQQTVWESRFPEGITLHLSEDWEDAVAALPAALGLVMDVEDLRTWPQLDHLRRLNRDSSRTPVVLITARDADNVASASDISLDKILWSDAPSRQIQHGIRDAFVQSDAWRVLDDSFPPMPPVLRRAFQKAIDARPPFVTVQDWAASLSLDRRTLWQVWSQFEDGIRLTDIVSWLLLRAAVELKRPGLAWRGVARSLRVHQDRLLRLARTMVRMNAKALAHASVSEIDDAMRTMLNRRSDPGTTK